jgi:hypothetical protein
MRFIKTFVLRLYIDSTAPERLCGDVRPLDDGKSYPFKDGAGFVLVLNRLVGKALNSETSQSEDQHGEE